MYPEINSLCEFKSCFKGQRWIVQVCKPYRLSLILEADLKFGVTLFRQENTQVLVDGLFVQDHQKRLASIKSAE